MKLASYWDRVIPVLAIIAFFVGLPDSNAIGMIVSAALLVGSILSAVHHSELIAHKVGQPYGTIILAVSITVIEVALIISLMLAGGDKAMYLARDTVFAAVMIILTIILGLCIVIGTVKHFEQSFEKKSVNTALVSLVAILVLTLVLPNVTTSVEGATFSTPQLIFVGIACITIYASFIYVQTIRHREYFSSSTDSEHEHSDGHGAGIWSLLFFLLISLVIVVLLAKSLSPTIEGMIIEAGLPQKLLGVIIASVILLPEAIAAIRAAQKDDIQTSLNLSFGSAIAAIGLTIPSVAVVSTFYNIDVILGLENKSMLLLGLSVFTVMLSLSKGKTNIIYGVILVILFLTYIFTIIYP